MKKTTFIAYDTLCSISISEPAGRSGALLLDQAKELALAVQGTLNMYDPDSELSKVCAAYIPCVPICITSMLYRFISLNLEFSRQTGGAFDFTVGSLVKLWDFIGDQPEIPEDRQLRRIMKQVGYQHVHLLKDRQEVVFDVPDITLDPGASGKGFALELAVDFLKSEGVTQAVLDFGGNLYAIGGKPESGSEAISHWRVGIRHPDQDHLLGTVILADRGIATSSWYEHSFCKDGTVYHHLLNPQTGKPQELDISSVSILSSQALYTDLLSTAFFVMGKDGGCALADYLADQCGVDADYVILGKDGSLLASPGAGYCRAPVNGISE